MCLEGRATIGEWLKLDENKRDAAWHAFEWWCEERQKKLEEDEDD